MKPPCDEHKRFRRYSGMGPDARRLITRYSRDPDGRLVLEKKYHGTRDERDLLKVKPLAFEVDLSRLPVDKRSQYIAFERAYGEFYNLFTGSGNVPVLSGNIDGLQREFEQLRAALSGALSRDLSGEPADE